MYQKRIREEYWQTSAVLMKQCDFSTVTEPFQTCNAYKFRAHLLQLIKIDCQLCKEKLEFIEVLKK